MMCLRPLVLEQDKTSLKPKKSVLVLVLQVWYCVVKHGLVMLVVKMILKEQQLFKYGTIYSYYILCLEHHYCGDQQWHSFT